MDKSPEIPEFIKFRPSPLPSEGNSQRKNFLQRTLSKLNEQEESNQVGKIGLRDKVATRLDSWNHNLSHQSEVFSRAARRTNSPQTLDMSDEYNRRLFRLMRPWNIGALKFDATLTSYLANFTKFLSGRLRKK